MSRKHRLIVQGEVTALLSAMRGGGGRWRGTTRALEESQDPLICSLLSLQDKLLQGQGVDVVDVVRPFCDVVVNEETTGPITGQAISALDKFLASGLLDPSYMLASQGIREVAEAVTHARFVGTSTASDEVVLMRILKVLNTLLLVKAGQLLTNESVCEIMQSCFRICFEGRLSELLRCFAENTLVEMIRLLFSDLSSVEDTPTEEVINNDVSFHEPVMEAGYTSSNDPVEYETTRSDEGEGQKEDDEGKTSDSDDQKSEGSGNISPQSNGSPENSLNSSTIDHSHTFTSSRGVRFTPANKRTGEGTGDPHGMPCIREVLRFLIAIINPRDKNNSDRLISIGLDLVTVMLECGGRSLGKVNSLRPLLQDGLCHHLLMLLQHESLGLFSRALRNCYLLFDSCRQHLKLQLEWFLTKLMAILQTEYSRQQAGRQELTLECLIQFCHILGFIPELYVNFDCSTYCSNVCEKLTKLLSKQAFPSSTQTVLPTNMLALDTLLAIISALGSCEKSHDLTDHTYPPHNTPHSSSNMTLSESAGLIFSSIKPNEGAVISDTLASHDVSHSEPNLLQDIDELVKEVYPGTPSELLKSRQLKKLITTGTEMFNQKPSKGVAFLMEQGVLQTPLDPVEVAQFLHQNPAVNKQMLGDYLGDRRNTAILENYVTSFMFHCVTLVDALREFLESFRLPGEAPVISGIMEKFSAHWLSCNEGDLATLFANQDAVFVLCYAILMLHTDLHNSRLKQKMTLEEFITARRGMNNGQDFPRELLTEIYNSIRTVEIILPSEHGGVVRDDYEWKVLLRRSGLNEGLYYHVSNDHYNQDIFFLCWGPAAAALSSALDNWPPHPNLYEKIINGYRLCAQIAAQYEQREVFDNLIISLSKFSTLLEHHDPPLSQSISYILSTEAQARLSLETMLSLAHRHGNLLREGWKNILDCLLCLFRARLLPEDMVTVPDFIADGGSISLYAEEAPAVRADSSLLSAFFSVNYWLLADSHPGHTSQRSLSPSEVKQRNAIVKWIQDCGAQLLFSESKFLSEESLTELTKALTFGSHGPDVHLTLGTVFDEESAVFFLELLITVTLENRDRVSIFLQDVLTHLTGIILSSHKCRRLRERSIVSLLQLTVRLLYKDLVKPVVLSGLQSLLLLPPTLIISQRSLQRQIARGLVELIQSQGGYLTSQFEWLIIFSLLEFVATSSNSHSQINVKQSGGCVTTSNEVGVVVEEIPEGEESTDNGNEESTDVHKPLPLPPSLTGTDWVVVGDLPAVQKPATSGINRFDLLVEDNLPPQDPESFFTACEALSYLVREEQHVTSENFTTCLRTVRLFTEITSSQQALDYDKSRSRHPRQPPPADGEHTYIRTALQLLDLLDALYLRTGTVFKGIQEDNDDTGSASSMWHMCWCPLLEGIARMCCDPRRTVRQTAIAYLQRGLLAHTLHTLTAQDWEACFLEVFFPMLSRLMEEEGNKLEIEEGRMRACNLLCKVFLQRLQLLSSLSTFNDLWVGILDTMDKYMHIEGSELLPEAIPESLKNMLLVMVTQGVLYVGTSPPTQEEELANQLWSVTWRRVEQFLPQFLTELFPDSLPPPPPPPPEPSPSQSPSHSPSLSPVMEQPRPKPATPPAVEPSPSSSPLSQSPNDKGPTFPIVIHPPLPTPPTLVTPSLTPVIGAKQEV